MFWFIFIMKKRVLFVLGLILISLVVLSGCGKCLTDGPCKGLMPGDECVTEDDDPGMCGTLGGASVGCMCVPSKTSTCEDYNGNCDGLQVGTPCNQTTDQGGVLDTGSCKIIGDTSSCYCDYESCFPRMDYDRGTYCSDIDNDGTAEIVYDYLNADCTKEKKLSVDCPSCKPCGTVVVNEEEVKEDGAIPIEATRCIDNCGECLSCDSSSDSCNAEEADCVFDDQYAGIYNDNCALSSDKMTCVRPCKWVECY